MAEKMDKGKQKETETEAEKEVTQNVLSEAEAEEILTKVASETEELPKAIVRRLVKERLAQISVQSEMSVLRDSLLAFSESARIFIHYLSAAANDICKESNRQIINAEDVFKALEEIDFPEFARPLRASLEEFREKKSRASKAKDTSRKQRRKETPTKSVGKKKRREVGASKGEKENAE